MPEIQFRISPVFLVTFTELVETLTRQVGLQLAVQVNGPEDEDEIMLEAWRDSLIHSVREDCEKLLSLFKDTGFGQQNVIISEEVALGILRACSAVRLKIQQLFLKKFDESELEEGNLDFHQLDPDTQQVYACYVFLAGLQETLVQEIEP